MEQQKNEPNGDRPWLLKYIIAVETTMILTMLTFWVQVYPGLASKIWVKEFVVERPPILKLLPTIVEDVKDNKQALKELHKTLDVQFQNISERLYRIELEQGIAKK